MSYSNLWSKVQVIKQFHGNVTGPDFVESVRAVSGDPRFDSLRSVVNDFSDVSDMSVDESSLIDATALTVGVSISNPRLLVAFVIPEGSVGQKVKTILAPQVVPSYRHQVFQSLADAQDWVTQETAT